MANKAKPTRDFPGGGLEQRHARTRATCGQNPAASKEVVIHGEYTTNFHPTSSLPKAIA